MLRVGQKVALTDDAPLHMASLHPGAIYPERGRVYTVRGITKTFDGTPILYLNEIDNAHLRQKYVIEPGFQVWFFRPIVERKTDISIFTKILDDVNAGKQTPVNAE